MLAGSSIRDGAATSPGVARLPEPDNGSRAIKVVGLDCYCST
jgi:hypothetical protein